MPRTVAIISDTHSCLHKQVQHVVSTCDIAIHAGDICNGDVLELLTPISGRIIAVRGNNDHPDLWPEHQARQIETIPDIASLELPGGKIMIEHGHRHSMQKPDHEDLRKAHPDCRMIVYGHTHKKVIDDYKMPWVVNPGAAGSTRTRGGASCLVLTASETLWKIDSFRFEDYADHFICTSEASTSA